MNRESLLSSVRVVSLYLYIDIIFLWPLVRHRICVIYSLLSDWLAWGWSPLPVCEPRRLNFCKQSVGHHFGFSEKFTVFWTFSVIYFTHPPFYICIGISGSQYVVNFVYVLYLIVIFAGRTFALHSEL